MTKKRIRVKTVDYYFSLIYNFGLIIPGFLILTKHQVNFYLIILIVTIIVISSWIFFRRYFYADFDTESSVLTITWSKNFFQQKRQQKNIRLTDIKTVEEPLQIGFYPTRFVMKIDDNSDFKIFNPIFSFNDDYERFKGVLNAELYYIENKSKL